VNLTFWRPLVFITLISCIANQDLFSKDTHFSTDMTGVYNTVSVYSATDTTNKRSITGQGRLIIGSNSGIWIKRYVLKSVDSSSRLDFIEIVLGIISTIDGRVCFGGMEGEAYDGLQTDRGFDCKARTTVGPAEDSVIERVHAVRALTPLSDIEGVYSLTLTTQSVLEYHTGGTLDWTGEAIVGVMRDTVYLNLKIISKNGDRRVAGFSGPLLGPQSGYRRFELSLGEGYERKTLRGSFLHGRFVADWRDQLSQGTVFLGEIEGRRK
jgi:hypothetical protein